MSLRYFQNPLRLPLHDVGDFFVYESEGNLRSRWFNVRVKYAAAQRDFTIELLKAEKADEEKAQQIENLREKLNQL